MAPAYAPDPGGVFASDTHRRVLGHLSQSDPIDLHPLGHRISADPDHGLSTVEELEEVLTSLKADGFASQSKDGWKMTQKGFDAITGPNANEPTPGGPAEPALLRGLEGEDG